MGSPLQSAPSNIVDQVLTLTNAETVSSVSQTSPGIHTYIQRNVSLWRFLFAMYFDLPEGRDQSIDQRSCVQSWFQAKHTILTSSFTCIPDEELENTFKTLVQMVQSTPPGQGLSKNITWLNGIFTDSASSSLGSPSTLLRRPRVPHRLSLIPN